MKKRYMAWAGGLISFMLLLSGCQTISGIDLNQVMQNHVALQSYEGNSTINIQFVNDGTAKPVVTGETDLSLLQNIQLNLTSVKKVDKDHTYMTGELVITNPAMTIPVLMTYGKGELAIQIDKATKPVVFQMSNWLTTTLAIPTEFGALLKNPDELLNKIIPYITTKLSNPQNISVTSVNETINNEALNLKKIHGEFSGTELSGMIKQMLTDVVADKVGVKALITQIYATITDAPANDFVIDYITGMLLEPLKKMEQDWDKPKSTETNNTFFDAQTLFKMDLFVDSASQIRKSGLELNLNNLSKNPKGYTGLKISLQSEMWKINQPVTAGKLIDSITNGSLIWDEKTTWPKFLKTLDKNSQLYKVLYNDVHVTYKKIQMTIKENSGGAVAVGSPYIIPEGYTMVPIRFVSENLGSDVSWDGVKRQVTIEDILTGKKIVLIIGSKEALIDGKMVMMQTEAVITNNSTYVPVRFVSESLGAVVGWNADTRTVTVTKN